MKAYQVQARPGHQCCQPLHKLHRRHHDVGGAVAPGRLELEYYLPSVVHTQPFVGDGRARDVAGELFKLTALIGITAHPGVQTESVGVGAQLLGDRRRAARRVLQAQRALGETRARLRRCCNRRHRAPGHVDEYSDLRRTQIAE